MKRRILTATALALLALPAVGVPASAAAPKCDGKPATIVGTSGRDIIKGTPGRDVIVAGAGRDTIVSGGGNDIICAGSGNDVVLSGDGRDRAFGGPGKDVLKGGAAYDKLDGGSEKDACHNGADGARQVRCEGADLKVIVRASAAEVEGNATPNPEFSLSWTVRNTGVKPAANVKVEIVWDELDVTCRGLDDPTGVQDLGTLVPTEFRTESYIQDCGVPTADFGTVELSTTASTSSPEADTSNNADSDSVRITKPV